MLDVLSVLDSDIRMIRSRFLSDPDRRELLVCVKRQREDHGIARRANALLLLAEGWESVAYGGWKGGQSRMTADQEAALCAWLEERFCRSTVEVRAYLQAAFGLRYSRRLR